MNQYTVYRHRRKDDMEVFYVGMTKTKQRPYGVSPRTKEWNSIYKSVGFYVDIVSTGLSYDNAVELERFLIRLYGRKDLGKGNLVNNQGGGKSYLSAYGRKHTKEHRNKLSLNSYQAKKVIDRETVIVYNSATEASKKVEFSLSHLKNMLNGRRTNKTNMSWV